MAQLDTKISKKQQFSFNWKIAASVVFLILAGIFSYTLYFSPKPSDFDFYEPGLPITMNHSNQVQLNNAMSKFKKGDLQAAAIDFENLLSQKGRNDATRAFLG